MAIWTPRHRPSKEPKFHSELMFLGQGSVIKLVLTAANKGCDFMGLIEEDIN